MFSFRNKIIFSELFSKPHLIWNPASWVISLYTIQFNFIFILFSGNVVTRLRFQSESEEDGSEGPLPDVIPFQRDRSVSLPDVPALRRPSEQEVGRELRRISDEFHSSFHRVRTVSV